MFGMGFSEIIMIAIIAVLFLGPDKLPDAMVQIVKFFKSFKQSVSEAKSTIDEELRLHELKEEALSYKNKLENAKTEVFDRTIDSDILSSLNSAASEIEESFSQIEEKPAKPANTDKPKKIEDKSENGKSEDKA